MTDSRIAPTQNVRASLTRPGDEGMALTRSWTDHRDGKVWELRRGLGVHQRSALLVFTHGTEQRIVLAGRRTELDNFTDEELEALLDQALSMHEGDA